MKRHYIYLTGFVAVMAAGAALGYFSAGILAGLGASTALYDQAAIALITVAFGYAAVRLLAGSILEYGKRRPRLDEKPVSKLVSLFGYVIILFFVLSIFHVNYTAALLGAGFLGIVIGLASQSTLGNFFAGISMMAAKPFAGGDRITFSTWQYGVLPPSYSHRSILPGYSGVIQEIGIMYTKLRLDDGTSLFVPNGIMNQAVIINYAISNAMSIDVRAELPITASFADFKKKVSKGIEKHKKLAGCLSGKVDILITDIGISNYGVDVRVRIGVTQERYVKRELAEIVMRVASRYAA